MLKSRALLSDEKGMAIIEMIPIMIIIVLLVNYSLGFFGVIHTGILNSIAARNYAFSTFNHRANLTYFRDTSGSDVINFSKVGSRLHATVSENSPADAKQFFATARPIDFLEKAEAEGSPEIHNKKIYDVIDGKRNETNGVSPVWVRPQYGICLNSECGPSKGI